VLWVLRPGWLLALRREGLVPEQLLFPVFPRLIAEHRIDAEGKSYREKDSRAEFPQCGPKQTQGNEPNGCDYQGARLQNTHHTLPHTLPCFTKSCFSGFTL